MFLERVTHAVARPRRWREFEVSVDRLLWAANYDQSRWFFALGVARLERDELNGLLAACNRAAGECGYPLLYDTVVEGERLAEPVDAVGGQHLDRSECFHFSLAWSLTSPNGHEDDEDAGSYETAAGVSLGSPRDCASRLHKSEIPRGLCEDWKQNSHHRTKKIVILHQEKNHSSASQIGKGVQKVTCTDSFLAIRRTGISSHSICCKS